MIFLLLVKINLLSIVDSNIFSENNPLVLCNKVAYTTCGIMYFFSHFLSSLYEGLNHTDYGNVPTIHNNFYFYFRRLIKYLIQGNL